MEGILTGKEACRARARSIRKARLRAMNEPPRLTLREEVINTATHGAGMLLAVAGMVLVLQRAHTGLEVLAGCVYGISMVLMMGMSSLYHAMRSGSTAKRVCRRFDYISIYLLIGGTFAPIFLVYQGNRLGITLFCVQWGIILLGATLIAVFGPGRLRPLHYSLFFLIGWSGLMFLPDFFLHDRTLLWLILLGGVVYTVGMIPFARKRKYDHCLWHVCVLAAAALQWAGIYTRIF